MIFYQNPFYDYLFGSFGINTPSTRSGYKIIISRLALLNPTTSGIYKFKKSIKTWLDKKPNPNWPCKNRLLVAIQFGLTEKKYKQKDIDNITKSLIDALKGTVYEDDKQIDSLHLLKYKSENNTFMIGIKELSESDPGWFFPPFCAEKPWKKDIQNYQIKTKTPKYSVSNNINLA